MDSSTRAAAAHDARYAVGRSVIISSEVVTPARRWLKLQGLPTVCTLLTIWLHTTLLLRGRGLSSAFDEPRDGLAEHLTAAVRHPTGVDGANREEGKQQRDDEGAHICGWL